MYKLTYYDQFDQPCAEEEYESIGIAVDNMINCAIYAEIKKLNGEWTEFERFYLRRRMAVKGAIEVDESDFDDFKDGA